MIQMSLPRFGQKSCFDKRAFLFYLLESRRFLDLKQLINIMAFLSVKNQPEEENAG